MFNNIIVISKGGNLVLNTKNTQNFLTLWFQSTDDSSEQTQLNASSTAWNEEWREHMRVYPKVSGLSQ
jgi:hypothetical protein